MSASLSPLVAQRRTSGSSRSDGGRTTGYSEATALKTSARGRAVREAVRGADSTRKKLLEVAGRVFAEHGYYAATVRDICAQAGSNVAAVNYHFRDKLGLY